MTLGDRVTGLHAVYAVTTALYARERSGQGQAVVVPMFEAMTQFILGDHLAGLSFEPPMGGAGYARLLTEHRKPDQTRRWLPVRVDLQRQALAELLPGNRAARTACKTPMFATHTQRAAHIDAVYAEVGQLMRQRTTAQWRTLLDAADVPNMPMASPEDLLQDPHHQATGFVRDPGSPN